MNKLGLFFVIMNAFVVGFSAACLVYRFPGTDYGFMFVIAINVVAIILNLPGLFNRHES